MSPPQRGTRCRGAGIMGDDVPRRRYRLEFTRRVRIARDLGIPVRFLDPAAVVGDATGSPTSAHVAKEGEG